MIDDDDLEDTEERIRKLEILRAKILELADGDND